jgi:hypothetical protein
MVGPLSHRQAATNYLEDEIRQRVARGAVRFKVVPQLAAPAALKKYPCK